MTRFVIIAVFALSACASYDRPTYNARNGCVERWTHAGTQIGLQASIEDRHVNAKVLGGRLFAQNGDVPRYAIGATLQFAKREDCPAPSENPVIMEAYQEGTKE